MQINKNMHLNTKIFAHRIEVKDIEEDEFLRLTTWLKENIAPTFRATPKFRDLNDEGCNRFHFRFLKEEDAMAFKLVLSS